VDAATRKFLELQCLPPSQLQANNTATCEESFDDDDDQESRIDAQWEGVQPVCATTGFERIAGFFHNKRAMSAGLSAKRNRGSTSGAQFCSLDFSVFDHSAEQLMHYVVALLQPDYDAERDGGPQDISLAVRFPFGSRGPASTARAWAFIHVRASCFRRSAVAPRH